MQLQFTKTFQKQYKKLPVKFQKASDTRLTIFSQDSTTPTLRVHPLSGNYAGYWSMSVSGDLRAIYKKVGGDLIVFALIGTHSQLY